MARRNLLVVMQVLLIAFALTGCAFAADIDLGEGYHVPASFDKILITSSDGTAIQNAVDHIQSGGTVSLSGDFHPTQTIYIKKNLTLKGTDSGRAVLDRSASGTSARHVIRCDGDITLENLTITGGRNFFGGGVQVDKGNITIRNCNINNNFGLFGGGGIFVNNEVNNEANVLTLESCDISSNESGLGGGITTNKGTVVHMKNCSISNNHAHRLNYIIAGYGGGLYANQCTLIMENCLVINNSADVKGGGISLMDTKLTTISCDISGNTAPESNDINLADDSSIQEGNTNE